MRTKINLPSGSILELDYTSYLNTMNLLQHLAKVIKKDIPDFSLNNTMLEKLGSNQDTLKDKLFSILPNALLNAVMDNDLIDAIFKCADNSLINDYRINKEYFENIENRQDFFPVLFQVVKYNLTPFFPKANMK